MLDKHIPVSLLPSATEGIKDDTMVTWDFTLPLHVDSERIVLNGKVLQRLMSVAAFRGVHISQYQGETSNFIPDINGLNGFNTAIAATTGVAQKVEIHQASHSDDYTGVSGKYLMKTHGKTRVHAELNKTEIASIVVDKKSARKIGSEVAWASEIDNALSTSLRQSAKEHLVKRENNIIDKLASRALYALYAYSFTDNTLQHDLLVTPSMYAALGAAKVVGQAVRSRREFDSSYFDQYRWSVTPFSGEQWDRYAVTSLILSTFPLISVRR